MTKIYKIWQRKYIKEVFESSNIKDNCYSKIILNNTPLVNKKNNYMPDYLFKYYSPTSENILDVKARRLWLSDPKHFNDPFDCNIGYDKESYEKDCLIKFIEDNKNQQIDSENGFTQKEKYKIQNSYLGNIQNTRRDNFYTLKWKILSQKSDEFKQMVQRHINNQLSLMDFKIQKLKNSTTRIACFSKLNKYEEFHNQVLMWSHYADNHRGFCVEYDLEFLKLDIQFKCSDVDFIYERETYIEERNETIIKAGLFPIEYTNKRINIPITLLNQINFDNNQQMNYCKKIDELIYKTYVVKSSKWSYEKEWRIIVDEKISRHFGHKIPFPYAKNIYLGCNASFELINTMIDIGKDIGANVFLLSIDGKKFSLESHFGFDFKYNREMWTNPYSF